LIEISGRLSAKDSRFSTWAKKLNVPIGSVKSRSEQDILSYELNALVALAYGLVEENLKQIYSTFQRGWDYEFELNETLKLMKKFRSRDDI
jgi:hypothetical protein